MPKRLPDRCQPDSIREFQASARQRYNDGVAAAATGRSLAAIYLWGYAAEMVLKAAYFSAMGLSPTTHLQIGVDINPTVALGRGLGIAWPGGGHDVRAWSELLILERATHPDPTKAYTPVFERAVQIRGQRIGQLWRETLRYHKNTPYAFEVRQIREATEWLLAHSDLL